MANVGTASPKFAHRALPSGSGLYSFRTIGGPASCPGARPIALSNGRNGGIPTAKGERPILLVRSEVRTAEMAAKPGVQDHAIDRRDGVARRKFEGEAPYDRNLMSLATEETVKRTWTIIGVADVPKSFKWYQSLLCLAEAVPAHDYFGRAVDSDGTVLLCLHEWGAHEHPSLTSPHYATPGNGLLLFFRVDNFDVALPRGRSLVSGLEEGPHCESRQWDYGVFAPRSGRILRHHQRAQSRLTPQVCSLLRSKRGSSGRFPHVRVGLNRAALSSSRPRLQSGADPGVPGRQGEPPGAVVSRPPAPLLRWGFYLDGTSVPVRRPDPWNWNQPFISGARGVCPILATARVTGTCGCIFRPAGRKAGIGVIVSGWITGRGGNNGRYPRL